MNKKTNLRGILEKEHKKENNFNISVSSHMTNGKNIYTYNMYIRTAFKQQWKVETFTWRLNNGNIGNQMIADKKLIRKTTALKHISLLQKDPNYPN